MKLLGFFCSGQGAESMAAEYQDFNFSLLFFLSKKASGTCPTGEGIYEPANVRPLNVTNTDNRLLANAVRMAIEKCISFRVSKFQRGFIGGRSLLANLVDVDEAMALGACGSEDAAAMFFRLCGGVPFH